MATNELNGTFETVNINIPEGAKVVVVNLQGVNEKGGTMEEWDKIMELLQPVRDVQNDLEGAALEETQLSAKTLLDLAGKLTAAELAIMGEYNKALTRERGRLELEADALYDDMGKRLEAAGLEGLQDHARRQYEEWKEKGGEEIAE